MMSHAPVPGDARLVADLADINFLHCDEVKVAGPLTAFQAYCAMTSDVPAWLAVAFRIRDLVSRTFNVVEIHGFSPRNPDHVPAVGDLLDFFAVEALSERQLVLTARDTHLAVMMCIDSMPAGEHVTSLTVTTSVRHFNTFGRLYMLPVGLAHGPIVSRLLRNVAGPEGTL